MKNYILFFLLLFVGVDSFSKKITVCATCAYKTISSSIAAAAPFDSIIVLKGTYNEKNIYVTKPLYIIGEGRPVIDGNGGGDIILVKSDKVTLNGLCIKNSGFSNVKDYAGIKVETASECIVADNELINNYFAIYLSNSADCRVSNNKINGNATRESSSGNGIHLWKSNNINIEYNQSMNHRDGIYLEFSQKCSIHDNISEGNLRYGLHFMFSHGNSYVCNTFRKNGAGVAVMYTRDVEIVNNIFEENWGPASYGLLLKDISKSVIKGNEFIKNTVGVYMEGVDDINIIGNSFVSNGWGVKLMGNCTGNKISGNNFMSNTFDLVTNSFDMGKQNYTSGNYWDKYNGYDLDKDKFGDVPYRPVSLFSIYVERIPYSVILLRSFAVSLLDRIEEAVPAVIPETLMDEKPKMEKISL